MIRPEYEIEALYGSKTLSGLYMELLDIATASVRSHEHIRDMESDPASIEIMETHIGEIECLLWMMRKKITEANQA